MRQKRKESAVQQTILLIDDEIEILSSLSKLLTAEGHAVRTASDGAEGLATYLSVPADVVISDLKMPGMDGIELVRRIKEHDEDAVILMLTGFASLNNAINAMHRGGAYDFLPKPISDIDSFLQTIERAMAHRRLLIERRGLERDLRAAKERAEAANRAKSAFIAGVSHDLRAPLYGILGMLEFLESEELDKGTLEFYRLGIDAARRLERLTFDIMDLSRAEIGKLQPEEQTFSLVETFEKMEKLLFIQHQETGIALTFRADSTIPETLCGDEDRLFRVLMNLVGNSFKFTRAGSITVEANLLPKLRENRAHVLFSVKDTGIGLADEDIDNLFEPFAQAAEGMAPQHHGHGLGLFICKQLVTLMGGHMAVSGEKGEGMEVYFTLAFKTDCPDT